MTFHSTITLKDGRTCILRNVCADDAEEMLEILRQTHAETDYLLSYPDEQSDSVEKERTFLDGLEKDERSVEIAAVLDGRIVGMAGIHSVGDKEKQRHRAGFGVSLVRDAWGLGVGRALTRACIACAKQAGFLQLELAVVADNERALRLYRSEGFVEYGRNPRGFRSRLTGWQTLILMRLELEGTKET